VRERERTGDRKRESFRERNREGERGERERARGLLPPFSRTAPPLGGARPGRRPGHARWRRQGSVGHQRAGVAPATPKERGKGEGKKGK